MVRTGPQRRQRIGDVAAETKVIAVVGRSRLRGTPGWARSEELARQTGTARTELANDGVACRQ